MSIEAAKSFLTDTLGQQITLEQANAIWFEQDYSLLIELAHMKGHDVTEEELIQAARELAQERFGGTGPLWAE